MFNAETFQIALDNTAAKVDTRNGVTGRRLELLCIHYGTYSTTLTPPVRERVGGQLANLKGRWAKANALYL